MLAAPRLSPHVAAFLAFSAGIAIPGASTVHAQPRHSANVCWSKAELAAKIEPQALLDERGTRRGPEALRAPPAQIPADGDAIQEEQSGSIRRVNLPPNDKRIALTFDLCERGDEISGYDAEIVDYLRANKIKATFFISGKWMLTHPERIRQLVSDPLFDVGNHTWEHVNLRLLTDKKSLYDEIERAELAYQSVREQLKAKQCVRAETSRLAYEHAPKRLKLFRFPYGACRKESLQAVAAMGMRAIQWDVSSGDATQEPDEVMRDILRQTRPGSIILFHANGRGLHTRKTLPLVVNALRKRGYKFVTVSQLLGGQKERWEITQSCFDSKPGDTDPYDTYSERSLRQVLFNKEQWSRVLQDPSLPHHEVEEKPLAPVKCPGSAPREGFDARYCAEPPI